MSRRNDITNSQVAELYLEKGMNKRQIAKRLDCSLDLIDYRLCQMNISHKSMSDCVEAGKERSIPLSKSLLDRIDGEMLGDGYIFVNKRHGSFRESFGFDKLEWAQGLSRIFSNAGVEVSRIYVKKPSGKSRKIAWTINTVTTIEFGTVHCRWYRRNTDFDANKQRSFSNRRYIKIVPHDLVLTPLAMLHWFIGDGTVGKSGGSTLCTQCFSEVEIEFLRFRLLNDLGISSVHRPNKTIGLVRDEHEKMLKIIGTCPVECYEYKWIIPKTSYRIHRAYDDFIDYNIVNSIFER